MPMDESGCHGEGVIKLKKAQASVAAATTNEEYGNSQINTSDLYKATF
jgi:hypothetical protein